MALLGILAFQQNGSKDANLQMTLAPSKILIQIDERNSTQFFVCPYVWR